MKVIMPDGTPYEEWEATMEAEKQKKNFRNWFNNKFPKGFASYNSYYILTHPWEILLEWKRQIKWAWQRVFRGWDDEAVYSIDHYLAVIIPQMVRELKRIDFGTPTDMFEGLPYENENTHTYSKESDEIASGRWHKILDEIADGFEAYNKISDLPTWEEEKTAYKKFQDETFELLKKYYDGLWW